MPESPFQPFTAALLVIATALVQLTGQYVLSRQTDALLVTPMIRHDSTRKMVVTVAAIMVLVLVHLSQVAIWAVRYYEWGKIGSFANALYFSLASFTTVGANDLSLAPDHRMVGALEAAIGMLMFGWSTALLVRIIQRTERSDTGP
ncbi:MAG: two pore domain potassium channel family protein [Proteobacteria bacterium]|nr:two pore domain potassium channel family protein [Pseudomonadota bacterium]